MTSVQGHTLLEANDPPPVTVTNRGGGASFLLTGDHAGRAIPAQLGTLGLAAADRARHIAVDIGVSELGALLAKRLDAPFVEQHYSRLVIDCNRDPKRPDAIPATSDGTAVPGNEGLSEAARAARVAAIFTPYHEAITALLAARDRPTIVVALHSFTPRLSTSAGNSVRPWEIGVLYDGGDVRFARAFLAALEARGDVVVGENEPYQMDDIDYSIPRHCYAARRPYVEIEVRQDLLADAGGRERIATILEAALKDATIQS